MYLFGGIILTLAVQSSSIILAVLTPLVGIGVISLDRAFSVTAGCQIGTTITGLIAAFANIGSGFKNSMQIALVHVFFNLFGTLIWAIIPFMRRIPLGIAEFGGIRTERYRWWAIDAVFLGRTHFCTPNLRIWYFFGQETYIHFVAQVTRIIRK